MNPTSLSELPKPSRTPGSFQKPVYFWNMLLQENDEKIRINPMHPCCSMFPCVFVVFILYRAQCSMQVFSVFYDGQNITGLESYQLFELGMLRTFQIAHEFTNMTVIENLMVVPGNQKGEKLLYSLMNNRQIKKEDEIIRENAMDVLKFLKIEHLKNERAGNLSGGQKKLLELARTMMVDAKIVFLDEVGAGVNKTLLKDISESILKLNQDKGYTFCMIEHDFNFISELCDPVIVLAEGSVLFKGSAEEVKKNEQVIESYLGKGLKR